MEKTERNDRKKALCLSDTGVIEMHGMEFKAFHGCFESEITGGNIFKVDFRGETGILKAAESDDLADTIDCRLIYDIIKREMGIRSNLLEAVAGRIVDALCREIEGFTKIEVTVAKHNPPLDGPCEWSSVTACWQI